MRATAAMRERVTYQHLGSIENYRWDRSIHWTEGPLGTHDIAWTELGSSGIRLSRPHSCMRGSVRGNPKCYRNPRTDDLHDATNDNSMQARNDA